MGRLLWILGEIVIGILVSGVVAALVVPGTMRLGWDTGPWLLWVIVAATVVACIVAGEWLRKRRNRAGAA
jgi:predicted lysophospholipase L1 biosynthesis ABC-type transport system permease subunit